MPAVATYWQLPEDEQEFLSLVMALGDVVAVPGQWLSKKTDIRPQPLAQYITAHDPDQLLFGLSAFVRDAVERRVFDAQALFGISLIGSPVVAYTRGKVRNGALRHSNLCAYWTHLDATKTKVINKPSKFVSWAKRVFRIARKLTSGEERLRGFSYRATPRVVAAVKNGELQLEL